MRKHASASKASPAPGGAYVWREWVRPLLLVLLVTCSLRSALADWNDVPTGSMTPTILIGDRVVVNKLAYDLKVPFTTRHLREWADPQRGEIVVCYSPADGRRLVKRVVGAPGDTLELRNSRLWVNGEPATYAAAQSVEASAAETCRRAGSPVAEERVGDCRHLVAALPQRAAVRNFGPITVPAGQYFLMGDNRDDSFDSRFFGTVARDQILGRAEAVALSLDHDRWFCPRFGRFGIALQ